MAEGKYLLNLCNLPWIILALWAYRGHIRFIKFAPARGNFVARGQSVSMHGIWVPHKFVASVIDASCCQAHRCLHACAAVAEHEPGL